MNLNRESGSDMTKTEEELLEKISLAANKMKSLTEKYPALDIRQQFEEERRERLESGSNL